ncbi:uncharacterized protein GIQ15_04440 [Arthroderma uncinatum]|uniref:uncharacterized protein n=1 Tax=Arthroderma uncinatum TaxID=74035 RepID=UPI00144A84AB|nr:uncharacterized protein GIQ15_04440 [Arthroderma uncinatum]KAF3481681.1 hypothetical protein GIQ15_04440 [Arthroderma uncinatum]
MASRIRPTSAPVASPKIDPDSEDAASAAALYVTQPQRTGFRTSSGLRPTGSKRSSKDVGGYDLASAGAAASYASRGSYAKQEQSNAPEPSSLDLSGASGEEPLSAASKAASKSLRDSGVSGLGDEPIKEKGPDARTAATGAMSTSRRRVESMADAPDGVSDLTGALSAATISHRGSQHGRPKTEKTVEFQITPKRAYNPAITNARREMYTSHPPVSVVVEEEQRRKALQTAAVSMAQQIYAIIPKTDDAKDMETSSYTMDETEEQAPRRQESQRRRGEGESGGLAAGMRGNMYRPRSQYFAATKVRPLSSSTADSGRYFGDRRRRSRRESRNGKSQAEYDEAVMAAARKNVNRMMDNIDNHIYNYSSRPSPAMMKEWERTANERVLAHRESAAFDVGPEQLRGEERLVPPKNVEDVARARVRPALHNIDDRVAARKARKITDKLDEERHRRWVSVQRSRDKEAHEINKIIVGRIRDPKRKARSWGTKEKEGTKRRYDSDEEEQSTWPYPPKRASHDVQKEEPKEEPESKEETIFQILNESRVDTHVPQRPPTPPEQAGESSKPVIPEVKADDAALEQESAVAEEATKEETAVTEQAGSQAKHVRKHRAVHKTWIKKPQDAAASEDEPPRQVERIEERIITEIEKERPSTPIQAANTPMASGALEVPESPRYAPSSHWSSSNESGPGSGRGSPGLQKQDESSKSKKRLGFPHLFHRQSRRDTSGSQGSFAVNRRSVPEGMPQISLPSQPTAEPSLKTPGSRLSRFQENL